jgi:hypothetical protein
MINGKNWPREGYKYPNGDAYGPVEIKRKWDQVSLVARNRGIWMHHNIERYFNGLPCATDLPEFQQFSNFVVDIIQRESIMPYRTEWKIGSELENIGGTIDFIGKLPDNTYAIFDWKRMKNVKDSLNNAYGIQAKYALMQIYLCVFVYIKHFCVLLLLLLLVLFIGPH